MLVRVVWKVEGRRWIVCSPNEEIPIEIVVEGVNQAPELTSSTDDVRRCFPLLERDHRLLEIEDPDVAKTRGRAWTTGGGGEVTAEAFKERWAEFTIHPKRRSTDSPMESASGTSLSGTGSAHTRGAENVRILIVPWPTRLLCLVMLSIIPIYTLIRLYRLFDTLQLTIGDLGPGLGGVLLVPIIGRLLNRIGSLVDDDNVLPWGGVGFRLYWTACVVLGCLAAIEGLLFVMLQHRTITIVNRTPGEIEISESTSGRFSLPPDRPMTRLDAAYSMCAWAEPNALCSAAVAAEQHCEALIACEEDPRRCDRVCRHSDRSKVSVGCERDVALVREERKVLQSVESIANDSGVYSWPTAVRRLACDEAAEKRSRCESPCEVLEEIAEKARAEAQKGCAGAGACESTERLCRDPDSPYCELFADAERACICHQGERTLMRRIFGVPPERLEVSCTRPTTIWDNLYFAWRSLGGVAASRTMVGSNPPAWGQAPFAASVVSFGGPAEARAPSGRLCEDPEWDASLLGGWFAQPPALTVRCRPDRWLAAEELLENSGGLERATGREDRDASHGFDRGIRIAREHGVRRILIEPSANCANVQSYQLEQSIDGLEIFVDETYHPTETSAPFVIETAKGDEIRPGKSDELAVIRTKFGAVYRFAPRTPDGARHTLYEPQQGNPFQIAFHSEKDVRKGAQASNAQLQCGPQGSSVVLDYIDWREDPNLGHAFHGIHISREIGSWSSTWMRTSTGFRGRAWFCRPPGDMKAVSAKVQLSAALPIRLQLRARSFENEGSASPLVDLTLEFLWTTPGESDRAWGTLRCSYVRKDGVSIVPLSIPPGHSLRRLSFKTPETASTQTWTSADNGSLSGVVYACVPPRSASNSDSDALAKTLDVRTIPAVVETSRGSRSARVTLPASPTTPGASEPEGDDLHGMPGKVEIDGNTCYWDPMRRTLVRQTPLPENCARSSKRADLQTFSKANPRVSCDVVVECEE